MLHSVYFACHCITTGQHHPELIHHKAIRRKPSCDEVCCKFYAFSWWTSPSPIFQSFDSWRPVSDVVQFIPLRYEYVLLSSLTRDYTWPFMYFYIFRKKSSPISWPHKLILKVYAGNNISWGMLIKARASQM